jgi:Ca-activated chloride channel family protein
MFEFASPRLLWLLVLLPLLAWGAHRRATRHRATILYSAVGFFSTFSPGRALAWRRILTVLRFAALALIVLGLARPRFGTVERDVVREGVDLFYCLDVSGSMRAEDLTPNRLEREKVLTAEMIGRRSEDRQGLVIFAGEAFVLCPLTFDGGAVTTFLKQVSFDSVPVDGTVIGKGLAHALKKLQDSHAKSRVIILLTDGGENAPPDASVRITPEQAMALAKKLGVRVYTVGIGSHEPAWATVPTQLGPRRVQMPADLNEDLLSKIASETGGVYRRATSDEKLAEIFKEIDSLEKSKIEMKEFRTYDERMALVCWPALALLLLEIVLAHTRFLKIP